jgi:hypothetical protein
MNTNKSIIVGIAIVLIIVAVIGFVYSRTFQGGMGANQPSATSTTVQVATPTTSVPTASSTVITNAEPSFTDEYDVSLPDSLILVDSQGRRTGKDPITGTLYHEIPGTTYQESGHSGELIATNMSNGAYTIYVLGAQPGAYWIDVGTPGQKAQIFRGTIEKGAMISYAQIVDVSNAKSSTLSLGSAFSSTVSVTSVPPRNL